MLPTVSRMTQTPPKAPVPQTPVPQTPVPPTRVPLARVVVDLNFQKTQANAASISTSGRLQETGATAGERATYAPAKPGGEQLPPERKDFRVHAAVEVEEWARVWAAFLSTVSTQEYGNCASNARADLFKPDSDEVLLQQVPLPLLLRLDKILDDIRKFVEKLPVLPSDATWVCSENGVWETDPIEEPDTEAVPQSKVLYEATEQHPAQVHVWQRDEVLGTWTTVRSDTAFPREYVEGVLGRIDGLRKSAKHALYEANNALVELRDDGKTIMDFLFQ